VEIQARAFSGEVDTGSPSENATTQREKSEARFYQNGIRSSSASAARSAVPAAGEGPGEVPCRGIPANYVSYVKKALLPQRRDRFGSRPLQL
jgi:hypothetical protein